MRNNLSKLLFIALLTINLVPCAFAEPNIVIKEAWIREVPPAISITAAYMIIENRGDRDVKLVTIKTPISSNPTIHSTSVDKNGIAKMELIDYLNIPPGTSIELKPGGIHIMLDDLKKSLKKGDKVKMDLYFENIGYKEVQAKVRGIGGDD